jgi:hypothetical protein
MISDNSSPQHQTSPPAEDQGDVEITEASDRMDSPPIAARSPSVLDVVSPIPVVFVRSTPSPDAKAAMRMPVMESTNSDPSNPTDSVPMEDDAHSGPVPAVDDMATETPKVDDTGDVSNNSSLNTT